MSDKFIKNVEDFECEHCREQVVGDGYTNHCPVCLWSKHVDVTPGDRLADCAGMMCPEKLIGSTPRYRIVHRCEVCKHEKVNDVASNDSPEALVSLSRRQ